MASSFRILCCVALVLVFGCKRDERFVPADLVPALFIRGQVDPNIGINVLVTKAISTGDTIPIVDLLIKNAVVILRNETGSITQIPSVENGIYTLGNSGLFIETGKRYQLEVQVPDIGTAISNWVEIPQPVQSVSVDFSADGGHNGNTPTGSGTIIFSDMANSNDYYLYRMFGQADGFPAVQAGSGLTVGGLCEILYRNGDAIFEDACLGNSTSYEGQISADIGQYFTSIRETRPFKTMRITFGTITKSYYDFLFSLEQPEEWENGLIEPKESYTNFDGGWGVFYASNTTSYIIPL